MGKKKKRKIKSRNQVRENDLDRGLWSSTKKRGRGGGPHKVLHIYKPLKKVLQLNFERRYLSFYFIIILDIHIIGMSIYFS